MTRKEKRNAIKERILLLEIRNFLTELRNRTKDETEQKELNLNIDKILLCIDLTKETK